MIHLREWNDGAAIFSYLLWRSSIEEKPFEEQVKFWLWTITSERGYYLPRRALLWRFLLRKIDKTGVLEIYKKTAKSFKKIEGEFLGFLQKKGIGRTKPVRVYPGFSLEGPGGSAFDDFVVLHIGPGRDYLPILVHELVHVFFETDDEEEVNALVKELFERTK